MKAVTEVERLWRMPAVRIGLGAAAFAAVAVVTYLIAHPRIYTGFASYDDEGYMLVALRSFLDHGNLYDEVFSQYGPFYYEAWGGLFSLLGLSANHDDGRLVTSVVWVLSSLTAGLSIWRMTRSALLGLATQILVFGALFSLVAEPMHPGGLICLLLVTILAVSCFARDRASPLAMALLGGVVMALILVKVNVGGLALLALALACAVSYPALTGRVRWLRPLVEIGFVAVPLLLVLSKADEEWARHYAVHVALAALAVVIVLRARSSERRSGEELWWLAGGLLVTGAVVCLAILAAGTSPAGLFEGVIGQPLRQSDAFSLPLALDDRTYLFDLLALAGAIGYWYVARGREAPPRPAWTGAISVLSIGIGLEMALSVIGRSVLFDPIIFPGYQFALLAFAWVALVPPAGAPDRATAFARLLLPPLAVLQALHAYPVAGSQVSWSTFLLIPVGALCVANGVRGLAAVLEGARERRALAAVGAVAAAILLAVLVNVQLRHSLNDARAGHDGAVPFGLPGAEEVRVSPEQTELYPAVVEAIEANCSSFAMLPGMNSFYIWTQSEPPTLSNATAWTTLFDEERQREVIAEIDPVRNLCLLRNIPGAQAWGAVEGPLVRYLDDELDREVAKIGDFELLKRGAGAGGSP